MCIWHLWYSRWLQTWIPFSKIKHINIKAYYKNENSYKFGKAFKVGKRKLTSYSCNVYGISNSQNEPNNWNIATFKNFNITNRHITQRKNIRGVIHLFRKFGHRFETGPCGQLCHFNNRWPCGQKNFTKWQLFILKIILLRNTDMNFRFNRTN